MNIPYQTISFFLLAMRSKRQIVCFSESAYLEMTQVTFVTFKCGNLFYNQRLRRLGFTVNTSYTKSAQEIWTQGEIQNCITLQLR